MTPKSNQVIDETKSFFDKKAKNNNAKHFLTPLCYSVFFG
jgi:hypothetical protein